MCIIQDGRSSGRGDVCTPLQLDILYQMRERNGERWRVYVLDVSVCLCVCVCVFVCVCMIYGDYDRGREGEREREAGKANKHESTIGVSEPR